MDSNNISYYLYCKNKSLIKDSRGDWIRKQDYDDLLWKFNSYKEELTLENAMLQLCRVIENLKLDASKTFTMQMLVNSMLMSLTSVKENMLKDKQIEQFLKGQTTQ